MSTTRSLGREAITVGSVDVPLTVHRTDGTPPIFAGFRQNWMGGATKHPDGEIVCELDAGAGLGSPYMTLSVQLPDGSTVHEYVNMTEFFQGRIDVILKEKGLA